MFSEKNYKLESKEDFAKKDFWRAKNYFQQAEDLAKSEIKNDVLNLLEKAMDSLRYAEDFGMRGEEMNEFKKKVHHFYDECKRKIENKK